MNQIGKILIAVICVCCAFVLIYFLVSNLNNFDPKHPKDVGPQVNISHLQSSIARTSNSNEIDGHLTEIVKPIENPVESLENLMKHENYKLFNNERCGVETGVHRIHNGKITGLMENPWMVALVYDNKTNGSSVQCAGTLISENLVLTAAHCLKNKKPIAVRLGDYNLASDPDCVENSNRQIVCAEKAQEITDFKILRHKYHFKLVFDDIALIKLNEPAKLQQNNINTICLPLINEVIDDGRTFFVTGWGRIDNNNTFSDVLLGTYVDYTTHEECSRTITTTLTKGHLCAGRDDGSDSCRGDSGGPLILPLYFNDKNRFVQYGIVSYGPRGGCGKGPGVYTNIRNYLKWILDHADF